MVAFSLRSINFAPLNLAWVGFMAFGGYLKGCLTLSKLKEQFIYVRGLPT